MAIDEKSKGEEGHGLRDAHLGAGNICPKSYSEINRTIKISMTPLLCFDTINAIRLQIFSGQRGRRKAKGTSSNGVFGLCKLCERIRRRELGL